MVLVREFGGVPKRPPPLFGLNGRKPPPGIEVVEMPSEVERAPLPSEPDAATLPPNFAQGATPVMVTGGGLLRSYGRIVALNPSSGPAAKRTKIIKQ
jgi:hypothetical protein